MQLLIYIDHNFSFNFGHYKNIFQNIYDVCNKGKIDLGLVHSEWKYYSESQASQFDQYPAIDRLLIDPKKNWTEEILKHYNFENYDSVKLYVYKGGVEFIDPLIKIHDALKQKGINFEIINTLFLIPFDKLILDENKFVKEFEKEISGYKKKLESREITLCFDVEKSVWNKYFDKVEFIAPPLLKDADQKQSIHHNSDRIIIAVDVWNLSHAPKYRNENIDLLKNFINEISRKFNNVLFKVKIADSSFSIDSKRDAFFLEHPHVQVIKYLSSEEYENFISSCDIYLLQYSPMFYKNKSSGHFLELLKHNTFTIGTKGTFLEDNASDSRYLYEFGNLESLINVTSSAIENNAYKANNIITEKNKRLLKYWSKDYFLERMTLPIKQKNMKSTFKRTDKPFVILGNGPSLKGFDFENLRGYDTIGMNAAYRYWDRINWYPTYYICLDTVVVKSHHDEIARLVKDSDKLGIKKFFVRKDLFELQPQLESHPKVVTYADMKRNNPLAFDCVHVTTGSFAARFAIYEGYTKMIMLGIDEKYVNFIQESKRKENITLEITDTPQNNPNYFFDDYQQKGDLYQIANHSKVYTCHCRHCQGAVRHGENLHVDAWEFILDDINSEAFKRKYGDIKIINGNPDSAVRFFPFHNFSDAVKILGKENENGSSSNGAAQLDEYKNTLNKIILPMVSFFGQEKLLDNEAVFINRLRELNDYSIVLKFKSYYNRNSFEEFGDYSPPMVFLAGPFGLMDFGNKFRLVATVHGNNTNLVEFENSFSWIELKIKYSASSEELEIFIDDTSIHKMQMQLPEQEGLKLQLGCGFLKRYWKGEFKSLALYDGSNSKVYGLDESNISSLKMHRDTSSDSQSPQSDNKRKSPEKFSLRPDVEYHSSHETGQDKWVIESLKGKRNGFFIDLGASDGKSSNNTLTLEESYGWNGILIEGNEKSFRKLVSNRPTQICLNEIIAESEREVNWRSNDEFVTRSGIENTLPNDNQNKSWRVGEVIQRKSKTLGQILDTYSAPKTIDYLAIDIEGGEVNALVNFPFDRYQVNLLSIEVMYKNFDAIEEIMAKNGYTQVENKYCSVSYEKFYKRNELL